MFGLAFVVVSNISSDLRVTKMADFVNSASSWILGIVFTLFSAFTAVQGITAATVDGVSYRAAKFAAKNYIPILGGYISEGLILWLPAHPSSKTPSVRWECWWCFSWLCSLW